MLFNTKNNIIIPCYKYRGKFHLHAIFHRHKNNKLQDSTKEMDDKGRYSLILKHVEKNPTFGKLFPLVSVPSTVSRGIFFNNSKRRSARSDRDRITSNVSDGKRARMSKFNRKEAPCVI